MKPINTLRSILNIVLCLAGLVLCPASWADNEDHGHHTNHSDVLLVILQHKIQIQKLQTRYSKSLDPDKANQILINQSHKFKKATELLNIYLAIPESRYPNMEMYHQSLISRGGLIQEFAALLSKYQEQLSLFREK